MSLTFLSVPVANGVTVIPLSAGSLGQIEITLGAVSPPSAGTMKIEGQQWNGNYVTIENATAVSLAGLASAPFVGGDYGHFQALRFTLAGVVGGAGVLSGLANSVAVSVPDFAFTGFRALVTQSYTEANVKNGAQFETAFNVTSVAAGATIGALFITGAKPVIIKDRQVGTTCSTAELDVYQGPTATQSTAIPVFNLTNIAGVPAATTVQVYLAGTITANGTQIAAPTYVVGSAGSGLAVGTYATNGAERVLAANTTYLLTFKNTGATAGSAAVYTTWYEGQPDLPRQ